MKHTARFISSMILVTGLLLGLSTVYAIDPQPRPQPNPGIPGQPVPELPKVKPPAILEKEKPDLTISLSESEIRAWGELFSDGMGGPTDFQVRGAVYNRGRVAVRGCEVDVFLSKDRKISPDDRLMGTIVITETIPPPAPGRLAGFVAIPRTTFSVVGIPAGGYFICARVDPRNRIIETDENNNDNCVEYSIRIYPPGTR